jgi:hypothetical protein
VEVDGVTVNVDVPTPAMVVGEKLAVAPLGSPETEKETDEVKPVSLVEEMVNLPLVPRMTLSVSGDAPSEKSGAGAGGGSVSAR